MVSGIPNGIILKILELILKQPVDSTVAFPTEWDENIIERTLVLLERDEIRPEDLPADIISPAPSEHTPATPGGFTVNAEYRIAKDHFNAHKHFAMTAAGWNWHFVDVVWIGLVVCVYLYDYFRDMLGLNPPHPHHVSALLSLWS